MNNEKYSALMGALDYGYDHDKKLKINWCNGLKVLCTSITGEYEADTEPGDKDYIGEYAAVVDDVEILQQGNDNRVKIYNGCIEMYSRKSDFERQHRTVGKQRLKKTAANCSSLLIFELLLCGNILVLAQLLEENPEVTGEKNRRIQTCNNTNENRNGEYFNGFNTHNPEHNQNDKGCNRCVNRTAKRLANREVHNVFKRLFAFQACIFTNTVEQNDSCID